MKTDMSYDEWAWRYKNSNNFGDTYECIDYFELPRKFPHYYKRYWQDIKNKKNAK